VGREEKGVGNFVLTADRVRGIGCRVGREGFWVIVRYLLKHLDDEIERKTK